MPLSHIATQLIAKWPFLEVIAANAQRMLGPCGVVLFGSRATGKDRETSDFDIVIEHQGTAEEWANFVVFVKESPVTLYDVDLIDRREASPQLCKGIQKEGILLNDL